MLGRALDWVENAFAAVAGVLLVGAVGMVVVEVVVRYFLDVSFAWVIELNENFMVYVPFIAAAWVLREGGHITVDLLDNILRARMRRAADVLVAVVGIAASGIVAYYGGKITLEAYRSGLVSLSIVRIPEWYVTISIPIGAGLLVLEFGRQLLRTLAGGRVAGTERPVAEAEEGV